MIAKARLVLHRGAQPADGVTASPLTRLTACHKTSPLAIATKWPRTTDRGAAAGESGALYKMKIVGPKAGNTSGAALSHATIITMTMAIPPLIAATSETALCSSSRASSAGVLSRARHMRKRVLSDRFCPDPAMPKSSSAENLCAISLRLTLTFSSGSCNGPSIVNPRER